MCARSCRAATGNGGAHVADQSGPVAGPPQVISATSRGSPELPKLSVPTGAAPRRTPGLSATSQGQLSLALSIKSIT